MTCAEGVRTYLLSLTPVTTLVGQRCWTLRWPQSPTKPAVLVSQISDPRRPHLRGTTGKRSARIQIDVIADTIAAARAVDDAICGTYSAGLPTGLEGFAGTVSGSFAIQFTESIGYRELYDGDELKQARIVRDWRIDYEA